MPKIQHWMQGADRSHDWMSNIEDDNRSQTAYYQIIMAQGTQISIQRSVNGSYTTLAPQVVRIETTRIQPDKDIMVGGRESNANALIFGFKDHPQMPDFDVKQGDLFVHEFTKFEIRFVFPETPGITQAWAEQIQ